LTFRNTPRSPTGLSPAEILFGYPLRDGVPFSRDNFKRPSKRRPEVEQRMKEVRDHVLPARNQQRGGRPLPTLNEGQRVYIQHPVTKKWIESGVIVGFGKNTREYVVRRSNGRTCVRNRRYLRPQEVEPSPPPRQPVQAPRPPSPPTPSPSTASRPVSESPSRELSPSLRRPDDNTRPTRDRRAPVRFAAGTKK